MDISLSINKIQYYKHSLFVHITLFFMLMIITSNLIIFQGYTIKKQEQIDIYIHKYLRALFRSHRDIVRDKLSEIDIPMQKEEDLNINQRPPRPPLHNIKITKDELNKELEKYDISIANISHEHIKRNGTKMAIEDDWILYNYEGHNYFYVKDRFREILIKDKIKQNDKTLSIFTLTILLNIVFITFYIFLIKKLIPLRALKKSIRLFAKGNQNIDTSTDAKDEISEVANEFNNAIVQIRNLTESRNLFLRNIMHEFKTPITRGFIIADMLEDSKYHKNLKKAFERLEYLLSELARIEILTSNNIKLKKEEFRLIDILDNSLDILLLDSDAINLQIQTDKTIFLDVDFEFFSIAIKNLIDNAIKYGEEKPQVIIEENSLTVKNKGKELEKSLEEYFKPFNRNYESSTNSLGLGLYIVHSILKAHKYNLEYKFEDGINSFSINF